MGILLLFLPLPALNLSQHNVDDCPVQLRRPAQTSVSVPLDSGGSDVLLMALIGRCVSLCLWKYLIHSL